MRENKRQEAVREKDELLRREYEDRALCAIIASLRRYLEGEGMAERDAGGDPAWLL